MKYIQNITLDVNCNPANYQYINAKQCDNASRVLNVTLTSNNQQIKPECIIIRKDQHDTIRL